MPNCPVCETPDAKGHNLGDRDVFRIDCKRCGEFDLSGSAHGMLAHQLSKGLHRRALMSHALRRMGASQTSSPPLVDSNMFGSFWPTERLPTPQKQADDLVLVLGENQTSPDTSTEMSAYFLDAWIGVAIPSPNNSNPQAGLSWVLDHLKQIGLIPGYSLNPVAANPSLSARLTMKGWEKYEELKKVQRQSRTAFMAMRFGDPQLDAMVQSVFKPAVLRTGFELKKLTDEQPAGLIDDQIRAALLSARFIVADLTHGSHGAYWEAGFAEGLGLPVIYTCEESAWEQTKTHFDTNHLLTIIWDSTNPNVAGDALTATIRATLRTEAKQQD
jgi:hypothetical protein